MRVGLSLLVLITVGLSCGSQQSATVFGEGDCNLNAVDRLQEETEIIAATRKSRFPTPDEMLTSMDAYRDYRNFIRGLDIPAVATEQQSFVTAIEDYIAAMNLYLESGGSDLTVNDYAIPFYDAAFEFVTVFIAECNSRQ